MRKKQVWRYYCDYCKKSGCSAYHIKKHEVSCTNNPERVCGFCEFDNMVQQPIGDLIKALGCGDEGGVKNLRDLSDGCPACMLAAIRQSKLQLKELKDEYGFIFNFHVPFDYQEEKVEFWKCVNDTRVEQHFY